MLGVLRCQHSPQPTIRTELPPVTSLRPLRANKAVASLQVLCVAPKKRGRSGAPPYRWVPGEGQGTSSLRPSIFADPNMAKNSANQNPLPLNAEVFSPPREVCGACSFLCVLCGYNQSTLTTASVTVTLCDYSHKVSTQTASCCEH